MNDKANQTASTTEHLPRAEAQRGPSGASAYFDRAGMLWLAACLALAVGAGHLIPQIDQLLRQPAQPKHQRLELSHSQTPSEAKAAAGVTPNAAGGQSTGAAISTAGPSKVW